MGDKIIRRHGYTVVGLAGAWFPRRHPMVFISPQDAQEAQFLKDNDAIVNERAPPTRPSTARRAGLLDAGGACKPAAATSMPCWCGWPRLISPSRWPGHPALETPERHPRQMRDILVDKAGATSAQTDRHVPGDPGGRERGHRGLHHLHHDAGQDARDRGAQTHRHAQHHHRP